MKIYFPLTLLILITGLLNAQSVTPATAPCHPKPAPPTVTGNFVACAGNGIELNVTADENCTIHWIPECNAEQHTGARYSIIMPIGGCNLRVVQENEAGCVSDTTLVSLEEFKLLPAPRFLTADVYDTLVIDSLYQPNARGEAPWHTYRNEEMTLVYSISVTGINLTSGCSITSSHQISVMPDPFLSNIWVYEGGIYGENHYGETNPMPILRLSNYDPNYHYEWFPPYGETGKVPGIYHPNRTGYYQVTVSAESGCIAQFQRNVYFKNVPQR